MRTRINDSRGPTAVFMRVLVAVLLLGFTGNALAQGVENTASERVDVRAAVQGSRKGPLTSITVDPIIASIIYGNKQQFTATGRDASGNTVSIPDPQWSVTGGTITGNGQSATYEATEGGDYTVTCRDGASGIEGTAKVHVKGGGPLVSVLVYPSSASLKVGEQKVFQAEGKDTSGYRTGIPDPQWSVSGGGTVTPNGESATFTATDPGDFTITCQDGSSGMQGTSSIHITNGSQLSSILISPAQANLQLGQQQVFQATGKDQQGNQVPIPDPQWSV
ncbi:MAG: hypothetical protein GXO82_07385, partial [Chlorobi bacterium]|nr:hypothetical protein [Chlorobiota bacterium]